MFVILMDEQIISCQQVCQNCLMADHQGQPRARHGQLCCGSLIRSHQNNNPDQYECQMGFVVASIQ